MRPQFFPWLFDDQNAWEKSLADPRFSYDLPIDNFMAIYQVERKPPNGENSMEMAMPAFSPMPVNAAPLPVHAASSPFTAMPIAMASAPPEPVKEESKHEEGILSQDEIDALLSGL